MGALEDDGRGLEGTQGAEALAHGRQRARAYPNRVRLELARGADRVPVLDRAGSLRGSEGGSRDVDLPRDLAGDQNDPAVALEAADAPSILLSDVAATAFDQPHWGGGGGGSGGSDKRVTCLEPMGNAMWGVGQAANAICG